MNRRARKNSKTTEKSEEDQSPKIRKRTSASTTSSGGFFNFLKSRSKKDQLNFTKEVFFLFTLFTGLDFYIF